MHDGKHWSLDARILQYVSPRSYEAETGEGATYRRNRKHLLKVPEKAQSVTEKGNVNVDIANSPVSDTHVRAM